MTNSDTEDTTMQKIRENAKRLAHEDKVDFRRVIDGKMYDTSAAKLIFTRERSTGWVEDVPNGKGGYTHYYRRASLYRTKKGALFLDVSGHLEHVSGHLEHKKRDIIALSDKEGRKYAEDYITGDEYIEAFGEPEEA